jgi:two-component system nitrogen regulation sensor histidine kinase NtrY
MKSKSADADPAGRAYPPQVRQGHRRQGRPEQCTETIVRQVDDIRRMVDEFALARMPKPVIEGEDVADTVRQVVFLMRSDNLTSISRPRSRKSRCGAIRLALISQALTNIIKNASEAIEAVPQEQLGRGAYRCHCRKARR